MGDGLWPLLVWDQLEEVTPYGARYGRPQTSATLERIRATLRAGLNEAVREGLIDSSPACGLRSPAAPRPRAQMWTDRWVAVWKVTGERPKVASVSPVLGPTGSWPRMADAWGVHHDDEAGNAVWFRIGGPIPEAPARSTGIRSALRSGERGRVLLRMLSTSAAVESNREQLIDAVPEHCVDLVCRVAKESAMAWMRFADELGSRMMRHGT